MRSKLGKEGSVIVTDTRKNQLFSDTVKTMEEDCMEQSPVLFPSDPGQRPLLSMSPVGRQDFLLHHTGLHVHFLRSIHTGRISFWTSFRGLIVHG